MSLRDKCDTTLNIRIPSELLRQLEAIAEQEIRTVSALVRIYLSQFVQKMGASEETTSACAPIERKRAAK
jgi:predicted transcriptional regulator